MTSFRYLLDPLFLVCVVAYFANRVAEDFGYGHWVTQFYLNDLICMGFWMPIMVWGISRVGLRPTDLPPTRTEIAIAFAVWSVMFEIWLPETETFHLLAVSDPWDIICYAAGSIAAWNWWQWSYSSKSDDSKWATGAWSD